VKLEGHLDELSDVRLVVDDEHLRYAVVVGHRVLLLACWLNGVVLPASRGYRLAGPGSHPEREEYASPAV
jgi:hypothetical protein